MTAFARLVHPDDGVRFTAYPYVDASDMKLAAAQVATAMTDKKVRTWGGYDGSGQPIKLTFADYYPRFIFDIDFTKGTAPPKDLGSNTDR